MTRGTAIARLGDLSVEIRQGLIVYPGHVRWLRQIPVRIHQNLKVSSYKGKTKIGPQGSARITRESMIRWCTVHGSVTLVSTAGEVWIPNSSYSLNLMLMWDGPSYVLDTAGAGWVKGREIRGVRARTGIIDSKPTTTLADIAP